MEYPVGWGVEEGMSSQDGSYYIYFDPSPHRPYNTFLAITVSPKSLREIFQKNLYLVSRFKSSQGIIADATINGLDIIIEGPDADPDRIPLVVDLEKDGHSYYFVDAREAFHDAHDKQILEHMIKSLHFLK